MKKFKLGLLSGRLAILSVAVFNVALVDAAEWKSEPTVLFKTQYNDNVRMRTDNNNPEGSTGYTLEPRVKFAGKELGLWDMSIDTRGRITRFSDIDNADSENLFFVFTGGRQTERSTWRLDTTYSDNTNFDNEFTTANPDTGLFDDQTRRKIASVIPSMGWSMSETLQLNISFNATSAKYEDVSSFRFSDYDTASVNTGINWSLAQNHQLGFTANYIEYDSPDVNFSYNQSILQLNYKYIINPTSDFSFSFGGRSLESLSSNVTVGCDLLGTVFPPTNGACPESFLGVAIIPVIQDIETKDDGTVVNLTYVSKTERGTHRFTAARTVLPSSFGGAQDVRRTSYQFKYRSTERWTTKLILDASTRETISGAVGSTLIDRTRYSVEPSVEYRLNQNWKLSFLYRYINIERDTTGEESTSNAIFVNLFLHWPRLVTTY